MLREINEQEFLSLGKNPIDYIGIYELDLLIDDNQLDCQGIIVAFNNKKVLVTTKKLSEDEFDFIYYDFSEDYDSRKIISKIDEPIYFVRKETGEGCSSALRFQIGNRPIIAIACEKEFLTIGISHWDINDEWLDFENNHLLNDL